jgi:hypothetical protein
VVDGVGYMAAVPYGLGLDRWCVCVGGEMGGRGGGGVGATWPMFGGVCVGGVVGA